MLSRISKWARGLSPQRTAESYTRAERVLEVASQETHAATIRFYERADYELVPRIPDFYKEGDDKLTFAKRIA